MNFCRRRRSHKIPLKYPLFGDNRKQERIPVGCVPPASVSTTKFMSVPMGVGPQVNKFEQVSSDDYHMSLVGWG